MTDSPADRPAPGWYEDPQQSSMLRWWDGGRWTNDIRPMDPTHSAGSSEDQWGLRPVGDWMTENFRLIVNNAGAIFTLMIILVMPASLLSSVGVWGVMRDVVVTVDDGSNGPTVDFEGFTSPILLGLSLGANFILILLFNLSVIRLLLGNRFTPLVDWSSSLRSAIAKFPAVLGWTLLGIGLLIGLTIGMGIFTSVAVEISPLLGVLVGLGLFVVVPLILWGRYSMIFTSPMAAASGARNPMEVHRITRGRALGVFGRCLLLALVSLAAYLAGSVITGPLSVVGGTQPVDPDSGVFRIADAVGNNRELFMLLQLGVSIFGSLAVLIWHIGVALLFEDLGGKLDPDLRPEAVHELV